MKKLVQLKNKEDENFDPINFNYEKRLQELENGMPIGAVIQYAGSTAPTNWLICDGSAISRITYAELFSVIGTTYGAGDGSTTFNLPNLKGRVPVGVNSSDTDFNSLGKTGGEKEVQLTTGNYAWNNYMTNAPTPDIEGSRINTLFTPSGDSIGLIARYGNTNSNKPHNNMPPYFVTNYIIKAL